MSSSSGNSQTEVRHTAHRDRGRLARRVRSAFKIPSSLNLVRYVRTARARLTASGRPALPATCFCVLVVALLLLSGCKEPAPSAPAAASPEIASQTPSASPSPTPPRPSGPVEFTDVSAQAEIHFKHNSGAFGKKYLPETLGTGCAFIDYDNDGWQDIVMVNSTAWPEHKTPRAFSPSITITKMARSQM